MQDEAWRMERCGYATASRFADILATIKSGEAASRRNYRTQLITERLTNTPVEGYHNVAMDWGKEQEPHARSLLESQHGEIVHQVGFIKHPTIAWAGCSPDGLIGHDGGIEIKCPHVSTVHLITLQSKGIPSEYVAQVQGSMWVTGRRWWLFVSYDPRFPENLRLCVRRVERDEEYIKLLQKSVISFIQEVEEGCRSLVPSLYTHEGTESKS